MTQIRVLGLVLNTNGLTRSAVELALYMTMTKDNVTNISGEAFWTVHPDPTQAAVHLALQWLAFVYPASELQIDKTLKSALPYADTDLSSRWSQFLDENDVEQHVQALEWASDILSSEQIPFLIETCWRLLLVDHELPSHVPLALRILARVLKIDEAKTQEIGETVFREYVEADESRNRAPLLPSDPRYLDRVEWRLFGQSSPVRRNRVDVEEKSHQSWVGFGWGVVFGAFSVAFLVFGPLQLGRLKVPTMSHGSGISSVSDNRTDSEALVSENLVAVTPADVETTETPEVETIVNASVEQSALQSGEASTNGGVVANPDVPELVIIEEIPTTIVADDSIRVLMQVTASILNVRETADVNGDILIKLAGGAKVWAYPGQAEGLWMLVKVEGETGYASARFLAEIE